ncbi:ferric reductase-like transmembrane domain-containing protein [Labilibaculum antarcticum]|uniref:ferric reductase-like transmembrane domain-containing protein n=1 Tax=Labilibaculum antarcticum TaxID=1717717 RepID=UPI000BBA8652|nr:ferric reductase-like transmembrane domain-containing protein [Labilibaculum antarcticum]
MEKRIKKINIIAAVFIFLGLPILFLGLGNYPARSILKEGISLLTIIAFCMMLAQFYLARSNKNILKDHKMSKVLKLHKYLGYVFVSILLIHPFLLVLPRYFESGVEPIDAFFTIITSLNSTGIVLGIIAWCLMLILGVSSIFRNRLGMNYKTWRVFHGILSIAFIATAAWHIIDLGRHIHSAMFIFIIVLSGIGIFLLLKTYLLKKSEDTK